ncbi:MAG: hypothetical protein K6A28_01250 [Bacteroidales bacterium]|nr:hypothetical protein [Bacteroidales bacterium]
MKRNTLYILLFALLAVLAFLPMAQEHLHLFSVKPLNGVMVGAKLPKVNMKNYVSGKMQSQTEAYISEHFGFRESVIRLYNQYVWDFYRKTYVKSMVIGKDRWLYGKEFTDDYLGTRMYEYAESPEQLKAKLSVEADRIRKVQEILAEYDKHLFVLLEPGKTRTYPEYLPDHLVREAVKKDDIVCAADLYPALFDSLGVHCLNVDKWFMDLKDSVDYLLYPQTGTHWSNLAALYATDSLIRYMEQLGNRNIKNLEISDMRFDTTMKPDDDMEQLLNVNRKVHTLPNQYAKFQVVEDSAAVKPNWIHIGDSYYWNISYHIPLDQIFGYHHYWYYNSTIYYDDQHHSVADVDFLQELASADYISLGYCTSQIYALSSYFSAQALVRLCYPQHEVNRVVQNIMNNMNSSEEWKASLQQKADAQGKPLETVMRTDALYMLFLNPEQYFPELATAHPSPRNPMLRQCLADDPFGRVLRNMYNDPQWYESLKQKAETRQLDLETVMIQDAEWMLKNTPQ